MKPMSALHRFLKAQIRAVGSTTSNAPMRASSPASLGGLAPTSLPSRLNVSKRGTSRLSACRRPPKWDDAYYSHTSVGGFSGILGKSYSGGVDSIQFRNMTGGLSPVIGNADVPGPWTPLTCSDESRMIGIYGWADSSVASIGIICSPGGCHGSGSISDTCYPARCSGCRSQGRHHPVRR
jgi:hypothetical protein